MRGSRTALDGLRYGGALAFANGDYPEPIPFPHCLWHIADNVVVLCQ